MQFDEQIVKLEYQWVSSYGAKTGGSCRLIHEGSCSRDMARRVLHVTQTVMKYYLPFHIIPLLVRLRYAKSPQEAAAMILKRFYYYVKSVLFMLTIVGGSKAAICFGAQWFAETDGRSTFGGSAVASLGILLEERFRQHEIAYFVFSKAIRSIYVLLKRKDIFNFPQEQVWMHVVLMAAFYYFYSHHASILKFQTVYEHLWGDT